MFSNRLIASVNISIFLNWFAAYSVLLHVCLSAGVGTGAGCANVKCIPMPLWVSVCCNLILNNLLCVNKTMQLKKSYISTRSGSSVGSFEQHFQKYQV